MIKAVIFDVDGVLINGEQFSAILERDHGISRTQTLPFFTGIFQQALVGQADIKEELEQHLRDWGWDESVDTFLDYWFTTEQSVDKELVAYIEGLKKQGIHVYVATNNEKHRTDYLWNKIGFSKIFSEIFSSAHLGHKKHEKIFFDKLLAKLPDGIEKKQVILWDDDQSNIDTAKSAGINAEFYTTFEAFKQKMDEYLQ